MSKNQKMMYGMTIVGLLVVFLALPAIAHAGGWAVVTLDQLPAGLVAGQSYPLGLVVRQHGQTPWQVDEIRIETWQPGTGQTTNFIARPDQTPGHYQVELVFPQPGRWEWRIHTGLFPDYQPMPSLDVSGTAVAPVEPARAGLPAGLFGALALLCFSAGVILALRFRRQRLPLLAAGGLMILSIGLAFASFSSASAQDAPALPSTPALASQDVGQQLFIAKGCVICHVNTRAVVDTEAYSTAIGPNLSLYHNDPEYLRKFLENPTSTLNRATDMPNLGLSSAEIDALVSFINTSPEK